MADGRQIELVGALDKLADPRQMVVVEALEGGGHLEAEQIIVDVGKFRLLFLRRALVL